MPEFRPDADHDAVLDSEASHLVVTSPPGTGKTCLAIRLGSQIAARLHESERVLILTFSNQARTQLEREAAKQLPPELRRKIEITNYHRIFWQGISAYSRALGLPTPIDIGSRRRRREALERIDRTAVQTIERHEGLLDSLAEHSFEEFRDTRTPAPDVLQLLLRAIEAEHRAGRLVFDDLGALFWSLLTRFPSVDRAYQSKYVAVIADEHQDASALQDALVRRLGSRRLVIFADEMQLIHEFRGADQGRLEAHLTECDQYLRLSTPHRWHGNDDFARWLLAMRERLQNRAAPCPRPAEVRLLTTRGERGFNAAKPAVREAVSRAFRGGAACVAVIARNNAQVADLRTYLCREGMFPRQIGTRDFEDAREEIEQLPLLRDSQSVALHALDRLESLVPTLPPALIRQTRGRLLPDRVDMQRAGTNAARILAALDRIYIEGPHAYFTSVVVAVEACAQLGHHLPRVEAVRAIRIAAETQPQDVADGNEALARYSDAVLQAAHAAPAITRGLLVMTAHQCKGKEFDAVILADASLRHWPDTAENRKLFYVVLTRAMRSLTVVAPEPGASPLITLC